MILSCLSTCRFGGNAFESWPADVAVELAREAEAARHAAEAGRHEVVQVAVGRRRELESTEADVVQGPARGILSYSELFSCYGSERLRALLKDPCNALYTSGTGPNLLYNLI